MYKGNILEKIIETIALPLVLYIIFAVISMVTANNFLTPEMTAYILKITCTTAVISMAISLHLVNGGFDFSAGAIIYLGAIVGGNIAVSNGYSVWTMFGLIILCTFLLGVINGLAYMTLRLPPIVISLAMVMIYEAITQIVFKGGGIKIVTKPQYAVLVKSPTVYIIFIATALVFWFIMKYTTFGFRARALATGQKIAVAMGVKEKKNVLIRYMIFGALLGVAATMYLSNVLTVSAARNLSSTMVMFDGIMPVVVGLTLAAYSNMPIGLFMAVLSMKIINVGFISMGTDGTISTIMSGLFLLAFVTITENHGKIKQYMLHKRRYKELEAIFQKKEDKIIMER